MKSKAATPAEDRTTLSVYPKLALYKKLKDAAEEENRSLAYMAGEILDRYFRGIFVEPEGHLRPLIEQEARERKWSVPQMVGFILEKYFQEKAASIPARSGG